jgi:hypothetical protein
MMDAIVENVTRTKKGTFKLHLSIDYDGIEEEAVLEYNALTEMPAGLIQMEGDKPIFKRGRKCKVYGVEQDAWGFSFSSISFE